MNYQYPQDPNRGRQPQAAQAQAPQIPQTTTLLDLNSFDRNVFNVLMPVTKMAAQSDLQRVMVNVVTLDCRQDQSNKGPSKDIYYEKSCGQFAITKVGGMKLAAAANISVASTTTGRSQACERCIDMAKATGKAQPCGSCPHVYDTKVTVTLRVPEPSGGFRLIAASREYTCSQKFTICSSRERERESRFTQGSITGFPILGHPWCQSELKRRAYRVQGSITGFPPNTGYNWCQKLKITKDRNQGISIGKRDYLVPETENPGTDPNSTKSPFSPKPAPTGKDRNIVEYLGIAADEPKRFGQLNDRKRAPLVEFGIDEDLCGLYCQYNNMLAPTYETSCRDGCWFCHNQGIPQLRHLRKNYPDHWALLLKWDLDSPVTFKADGHTVHDFDRRFQMEDDGVVPIDNTFRWEPMLDALASTIYAAKLSLRGETVDDDDKRIRASGLYDDWSPGSHTVGEIFNADGQTWECYQAYDNAVYPDVAPGNAAWFTFNRPLHGKAKETARPWVAPTHSMDIYKNGEYMIWTDGLVYCCTAPNGTDYSPTVYPDFWEVAE